MFDLESTAFYDLLMIRKYRYSFGGRGGVVSLLSVSFGRFKPGLHMNAHDRRIAGITKA